METQPALDLQKLAVIGLILALVAILGFGLSGISAAPEPDPNSNAATSAEVKQDSVQAQSSNIDLLKYEGVTVDHIDALQYAFYQFAVKEKLPLRELVIDKASVKSVETAASQEEGILPFEFNFSYGDKQYKGRADFSLISSTRLTVRDANGGGKLFESDMIDANTIP
ncbi:hypothetical protein JNJ66_07045 [Candidatus Saccharibacteria bacterium]|nr:hypothetical protein [Candidatus Saccharibacteria bacterium]